MKRNKSKIKTYQKQSQHKPKNQKGRGIHHENNSKNNRRKKETTEKESNLGFKKGMLGKLVLNKQANINKGTGNKKEDRRNQKTNKKIQKGVDGQKTKIFKGEDKEKKGPKNGIGRKKGF